MRKPLTALTMLHYSGRTSVSVEWMSVNWTIQSNCITFISALFPQHLPYICSRQLARYGDTNRVTKSIMVKLSTCELVHITATQCEQNRLTGLKHDLSMPAKPLRNLHFGHIVCTLKWPFPMRYSNGPALVGLRRTDRPCTRIILPSGVAFHRPLKACSLIANIGGFGLLAPMQARVLLCSVWGEFCTTSLVVGDHRCCLCCHPSRSAISSCSRRRPWLQGREIWKCFVTAHSCGVVDVDVVSVAKSFERD